MSLADEIAKLQSLRASGVLTDAEFETAKARLLGNPGGPPPLPANAPPPMPVNTPPGAPLQTGTTDTGHWGMILHFSMLAGFVVPYAGLIAPIVIWQVKKKELPAIDPHGCNAANWILTYLIFSVICIPLVFILIGIPLLIMGGIVSAIFSVIAALKAGDGIVWSYPMAITFFRPQTPRGQNW